MGKHISYRLGKDKCRNRYNTCSYSFHFSLENISAQYLSVQAGWLIAAATCPFSHLLDILLRRDHHLLSELRFQSLSALLLSERCSTTWAEENHHLDVRGREAALWPNLHRGACLSFLNGRTVSGKTRVARCKRTNTPIYAAVPIRFWQGFAFPRHSVHQSREQSSIFPLPLSIFCNFFHIYFCRP